MSADIPATRITLAGVLRRIKGATAEWIAARADFPASAPSNLNGKPLWLLSDVLRYIRDHADDADWPSKARKPFGGPAKASTGQDYQPTPFRLFVDQLQGRG